MDFQLLSEDDRQRFDEQGYLVVRNALSQQQIEQLTAASDRLLASDQVQDRARLSTSYDGFRNVIAHGGEAFERLLTQSRTVPLAAQLLSRNLQLHTSQLIYKHPEPEASDPLLLSPGWHRDIHTIPSDLGEEGNRRLEVKIAYYLSPAHGRRSGVTLVAQGSNCWTRQPNFDSSGDPPDVVVPDLDPGDALLFENRTWHAAQVNTSSCIRKCIIYGYSYRWLRPDDWIHQAPELLERADPIGRELLTPMHWKDAQGRFEVVPNIRALPAWFDRHQALGAAEASKARRVVAAARG
jgi:ectoine hydroxylase-related dioxygenase (phytanoyl-CoA dioxygenase family)